MTGLRPLLLAALPALALCPAAVAQTDEDGVRAAVLHYFEGGNTGDPDRVAQGFETEQGHFYMRRSDEHGDHVAARNLGEFAQVFTNAPPYERMGRFEDIRIADERMAFVHFVITMPGREFDDFFLLYKLDEEWKIVSKAASLEMLEE